MDKISTSSDRHERDNRAMLLMDSLTNEILLAGSGPPVPIFFRADDVGVISGNFLRLLHLFYTYRVPLCLAVVPAWLTRSRWKTISAHIDTSSANWCWHQHGWTHTNHQRSGKKCEFGIDRSVTAIERDVLRGKKRLESIIGSSFYPAFTPPWNRCTAATVDILDKLGFNAVSRSLGEQKNPVCLPDYYINVDLHTRKEADPISARNALQRAWRRAVDEGWIGVMIHHQLMGEDDFALLERLLKTTAPGLKLRGCTFADLGRS